MLLLCYYNPPPISKHLQLVLSRRSLAVIVVVVVVEVVEVVIVEVE